MDKKDKKHMEVLRQRQAKLQLQLSGSRKQADDPAEIKQLELEMKSIVDEIEKLKTKSN